jgi:hypothetical protein
MLASQVFDLFGLDWSDPRFFVPWRLSGLLSGYLPTDTRPQARAKLGKNANSGFDSASQDFFCAAGNFLARERASTAESEQTLSLLNKR